MTRAIKSIWTPLMLGGIVPGVSLPAALGLPLAAHSFTLANDHTPASIWYQNVTSQGDGDSDDVSPSHSGAGPQVPAIDGLDARH